MESLSDILNEVRFPGNTVAFHELKSLLAQNQVAALTGAGVSVPLYPTWAGALNSLLSEAISRGLITSEGDITELRSQIPNDPLEVAQTLEDIYTRHVFRSKIGDLFGLRGDEYTAAHSAILNLPISSIITLNYDSCFEAAYVAKESRLPKIIQGHDESGLIQWVQTKSSNGRANIVHLHGVSNDPSNMIFTSDDYYRSYNEGYLAKFTENLWLQERFLVVGFGFTDPFLTRIAENVLRRLPVDLRHFALIGRRGDHAISALARQQFAKKYRLSPVFYSVREIELPDGQTTEDHSELTRLLEALSPIIDAKIIELEPQDVFSKDNHFSMKPTPRTSTIDAVRRDFARDLFTTARGEPLYVEPRLRTPANPAADSDGGVKPITLEEVVDSAHSYFISCPPETGSTTLCRRILRDSITLGYDTYMYDAGELPNYRRKLSDQFGARIDPQRRAVLILDGFNLDRNERLLRELESLGRFDKIVLCLKSNDQVTVSVSPTVVGNINFRHIELALLQRPDIRTLAADMFDSNDDILVSNLVDKIYADLLDLCIPLTPANVIMYLRILYREGDFAPLNRVQIVNRYIQEVLRRPSEVFQNSFNSKNKMDILSSFAHDLYKDEKPTFTEQDWFNFTRRHMSFTLVDFDAHRFLNDLIDSRLFIRFGTKLMFKYRFFFAFFLGRYVGARTNVLKDFLENASYLNVEGIVEVISGLSADNTILITELVDRLDECITDFRRRYIPSDFDPLLDAAWSRSADEDDLVWKPIREQLIAGPKDVVEMDELKRSLIAERRTENQEVVFKKFDELERRLVAFHLELRDALKNSDDLSGDLKIRSAKSILEGYKIIYQVAIVLRPVFEKSDAIHWNGILFISNPVFRNYPESRKFSAYVTGWMRGIVSKATDDFGTRKLGQVFEALAFEKSVSGFEQLLNFTCLIRSKPKNLISVGEGVLGQVDRQALYLRSCLNSLVNQFTDEVNTIREREDIKRLIAFVQSKRALGKEHPGSKAVSRVLNKLEDTDFFSQLSKPQKSSGESGSVIDQKS